MKSLKYPKPTKFWRLRYRYHDFIYRMRRASIPHKVYHKWVELCEWINPRNSWATNVIPNHWSDKTYLIPEILFAAIIHFIEGEKALETTVWAIRKEIEVMEVYDWAKTGRAAFLEKIEKAYPVSDPYTTMSGLDKQAYKKLYAKVDGLEAEMEKIETKHLVWIVKNRASLWS